MPLPLRTFMPKASNNHLSGLYFLFLCMKHRGVTYVMTGFSGGSDGKESACNARDLGSIPGLGKSPGEGRDCLLQYSGLENSMDCIVHGVSKSWAWLRNFRFHSRECHKSIKTHACIQSVEGLDRTGSKGRRNLPDSR